MRQIRTADAGPPRFLITRGGTPTAEQLAALTIALSGPAPQPDAAPARPPDRPGWARAALLEGLGHRPLVSPVDAPTPD